MKSSLVCALLLFTLTLSHCVPSIHGLYFLLSETEKKCFIEELPSDTLVKIKYKIEVQEGGQFVLNPLMGFHVIIKDPFKKVLIQKDYAAQGVVTFTSDLPGEHVVCMSTNTTRYFGGKTLRVELDISEGEEANDYQDIMKKEKLSEIQVRVRQVIDQVHQIANEQAYQRIREAKFRDTSESTNARVLWWSIAQTGILLATTFWQIHHLRSFFRKKKLV